ncbi:hypothetical protein [Flavobacterium branchiarum]|uniref:T9SS type A sorting domain-containing protein n=1 Tax=Flavobacterium branchiarum TaxID=1114870 RepID=A0ABV5FGK0_9FLAO
MSVSNLPKGLYVIKVTNKKKTFIKNITIN